MKSVQNFSRRNPFANPFTVDPDFRSPAPSGFKTKMLATDLFHIFGHVKLFDPSERIKNYISIYKAGAFYTFIFGYFNFFGISFFRLTKSLLVKRNLLR